MATVFPFNQIPKIPLTVLTTLVPLILKQKNILNKLSSELEQKINGLPAGTSCNDANITAIKSDLAQIQKSIGNISQISNALQPISNTLKTITTVANVLVGIQLAIPAIVGVPEGPKQQTLQAVAELIQNITIVLNVLNTFVSVINELNSKLNNVIAAADSKIKSICSEQLDTANINASADVISGNYRPIDNIQLNSEYPSEFYSDVNVSDDNIQTRINEIQNLVNEQIDVLQNLIESPSKVITGSGFPAPDLGNTGDYYVDTETQTVYGPKSTQNSWT